MTQLTLTLHLTDANGDTQDLAVQGPTVVIGRGNECAVRLSGWRIGKEHARIVHRDKGWMLEDLGHLGGTWVNGARAALHGPLSFADQIQIGGYKLRVRDGDHTAAGDTRSSSARHESSADMGLAGAKGAHATPIRPAKAEVHQLAVASPALSAEDRQATARLAASQARHPWRKRVHDQLLETIDLRRRDLTRMSDAELRSETERLIRDILDGLTELPPSIDREALRKEVLDEAVGLGPLEDLLADETVTEIMVNRSDEIFVEQRGRLTRYPLAFTSDRAVMGVIERIVAPLGRRIDESSPLVDARLRDGSRVNAIIPPLAIKGPTLTIRKFSKKRLEASDMVGFGSLDEAMVEFLRMCVHQRKNLIVSGGTGSGKTTLLNVLSNFIPDGERIVTIEDAAELRLNHSHLVSLESRPSNIEGRGAVSIRDLVRNALRMRPDRIVVGECRGGEALDMLQAMNTGHEGSLTTLHANTPRDALARLETLVLMAGMDLPITAIREQVVSAVDLIVQQTRFACGTRKITSITEVTGIENGKVQMQELFRFDQRGYAADNGRVQGQFTGCNAVPSFYDELRERGVECDLTLFDKKVA
jgi:pilus assembly protein CpaF